MARRIPALGRFAVCAALVLAAGPRSADAAPKAKPRLGAQSKPKPKKPKQAAAAPARRVAEEATSAGDNDAHSAVKASPSEGAAVKAAGTAPNKNEAGAATPSAAVQETKENKEGVKTYKFGTIEVEGRLKSPQIIYFLRRVRAEFDAGLLGHRSFLLELSDTRNDASLR